MNSFLSSIIPEPFVILGKRLRPFSIGHALHMDRFNCPQVLTEDQLILAVLICSMTFDEFTEFISAPGLKWRLRLWRFRLRRTNWPNAIALFNEYLQQGARGPEVGQSDEPGALGASFLGHLKVCLCSKLHYSRLDVLNMSYSEALWDYYTFWENQSNQRIIITDEELNAPDELDPELEARLAAAALKTFGKPLAPPSTLSQQANPAHEESGATSQPSTG